jgi:hypothetical protein
MATTMNSAPRRFGERGKGRFRFDLLPATTLADAVKSL